MPELEHQQAPEAASHGPATEQVIVHQLANSAGLKVAALQGAGLEQDHEHVFEFVAHPVDERERESLLLAIEHFAGHADSFRQLSQDVFLPLTAQFPLGRQAGDPFDEEMIEEGDADL